MKNVVIKLQNFNEEKRITKAVRHFGDALNLRQVRHDIECIKYKIKKKRSIFIFYF